MIPEQIAHLETIPKLGEGLGKNTLSGAAWRMIEPQPVPHRPLPAHVFELQLEGGWQLVIHCAVDQPVRLTFRPPPADKWVDSEQLGRATINEVRRMENLPPVPWGDRPEEEQPAPDMGQDDRDNTLPGTGGKH